VSIGKSYNITVNETATIFITQFQNSSKKPLSRRFWASAAYGLHTFFRLLALVARPETYKLEELLARLEKDFMQQFSKRMLEVKW